MGRPDIQGCTAGEQNTYLTPDTYDQVLLGCHRQSDLFLKLRLNSLITDVPPTSPDKRP